MSERKHKYTDLEREELESPITPKAAFIHRLLDTQEADLVVTEIMLKEMAKRLEWQYDSRIDPDKPQYSRTEGELTICCENSRLAYVIQAPLIHKRVKITVPDDVYHAFEYMATAFHDSS